MKKANRNNKHRNRDQKVFPISVTAVRAPSSMGRVHTISQIVHGDAALTFSVVNVYGQLVFRADELPQWATFASLYDQYRITRIEVQFRPVATTNAIQTTTVNVPMIATAIDYTASANPTTFTFVEEYETCMVTAGTTNFVRAFTPRALTMVYRSAINTGYGTLNPGTWLDTAYGDIPHYGLIYAMSTTNGNFSYEYLVRYDMAFRNVK